MAEFDGVELDFDPDMPVKICHLGQAAVAALLALVTGGLVVLADGRGAGSAGAAASAVVCAGQQTVAQLVCQATAAACGASASASAEPTNMASAAGLEHPGQPSNASGMFNPSCRTFRLHLTGAMIAALMSWLVLAPGLEFSLAATAILMATGSVGTALAFEAFEPGPRRAPPPAPSVKLPVLGRPGP
ncbi:unnamed protein product [Effrenium voratum]|nr:unnamed protein product [Effrenium voratum]